MFSNVGQTLRLMRELRRKSQISLSKDVGIGKSQLSKYENGRELPKLESLEKVLKALRVSYFEFFYTLSMVDRWTANLRGPGDRGAAKAGVAPDEPVLPLPPFLSGDSLLAETTDQAFNQVFADLLLLYRRLFERIVISGVQPAEKSVRRRRRVRARS